MGVRLATCAPHRMLTEDQRALNGLLFARRMAERLSREEFSRAKSTPASRARSLTPLAAVDLCAEAIARQEPEIGAIAALDIAAARRTAPASGLRLTPAARV